MWLPFHLPSSYPSARRSGRLAPQPLALIHLFFWMSDQKPHETMK